MGSNALAFKNWAVNENVIITTPVEHFNGKRIGIDADDYLQSLLVSGNREPLLPAHGGQPFTLQKRVDEDLEGFQAAGIEPVFVFNGLDTACRYRASILNDSRRASAVLNEAWQIYDQGKGEEAVANFGKACTYRSYHIARSLQMYLHKQGVRIQVALYTAAAQLAQLEREDFVDAVQGSASSFLYGADKVVVNFDWEKKQVVWIPLHKCLAKLDLNHNQFVAACLISGISILHALPELDTENPARILAAKNLLRSVNYDVDSLLRHKDGNYHNLFHKARFALKHPIVMSSDGKIEPFNFQSSPSDVHEFMGQRLPDEIYYYLSRGLIGSRALTWRTRMEVLETPPLDGGLSPAYKDLVQTKLKPMRTQTLALMTHAMHRYYQKNDVELVCWFDEANKRPLNLPEQTEPMKTANSWHVKASQLPSTGEANLNRSSLLYSIASLSKESEAKKTVTPRQSGSTTPLRDTEEVRLNTIWRFLHDRGYINSDHTLSAWGKALHAALERADGDSSPNIVTGKEKEEAILIAMELLRLDVLGTQQMFPMPPYTGAPFRGSEADKSNALLISRVACLGSLQHAAIGYTGPLSRNLLAYHQTVAAVRNALRDLLEMHAMCMFLSGVVDRKMKNTTITDLGASLPLMDEPDVGLGLVVKSYLDELSSNKRSDIAGWFAHALDIQGDLQKAWNMWDAINAGVQSAESSIVNSDTKMTFKNADDWLKEKLEHANAPNGTA